MKKYLLLAIAPLLLIAAVVMLTMNTNVVTAKAVKPPLQVGDIVIPQYYEGGFCGWSDCDGQPWPYPNPYCRSADWIGKSAVVVSISTYCVTLRPLSPIVPGTYYIQWDKNALIF